MTSALTVVVDLAYKCTLATAAVILGTNGTYINRNILNDIFGMINSSLKLGTFFDTITFFVKSFFGDYRKTRNSIKIKTYSISELKNLLDEMKLEYEIYKGITNIEGRISILINF